MRHVQIYTAMRAVVQAGSFRKASELLAISPSALTRQIKALEEEIGDALFDRLSDGVRLSTIGEIYYRCFNDHLDELRAVSETVSELRGVRIGHVRISVSAELAHGFLQTAINQFRQRHPKVTFEVTIGRSDGFATDLALGLTDLALILQPQYRTGVTTLAVDQVPLVAVVPDSGKLRAPLRSADFLEHDVILPPNGNGLREWLDVQLKVKRLDIPVGQISETLVRPNRATGRPSLQFWPELDLVTDKGAPSGAQRADLWQFPSVQVVLCQKEGRYLPVAAARFAAYISEKLQG